MKELKLTTYCSGILLLAQLLFSQLVSADFSEDRFLEWKNIPVDAREWLRLEQTVNDRDMGSWFFKLNFEAMDAAFDPSKQVVFKIGYLEVPVEEAWFRVQRNMSPATRRAKFFRRGGKEYVRYFIHPLMEERYTKEYQLYGREIKNAEGRVVGYGPHYGTFGATPTSSPRSLFVWNLKNPSARTGEKVSLAVNIQTDRKNLIDKLERAFAINQIVTEEISEREKSNYRLEFFAEPMIQNTYRGPGEGNQFGNITRDFGNRIGFRNGMPRVIPGFALTAAEGGAPILAQMIRRSGMPAEDFIRERVMQPLVRAYAYLMFAHGLIGEPHQQNVLFEVNSRGDLTGRVIFRDLDAFKPDIQLRHIQGKGDVAFLRPTRPYKIHKMGKAEWYYRISYNWYLKHNWIYNLEDSIKKRTGDYRLGRRAVDFSEMLDQLMLKEMVRYLGFRAVFDSADMRLQMRIMEEEWKRHKSETFDQEVLSRRTEASKGTFMRFVKAHADALTNAIPEVEWKSLTETPELNSRQVDALLKSFSISQIFGVRHKNGHERLLFDPNRAVEKFKEDKPFAPDPRIEQTVLRKEYERLVFNFRSSTIQDVPENAFFILHKGSVTAHRSNGSIIGHAFLEPETVAKPEVSYYAEARYPRIEPNKRVLQMLYDFANGKIKRIGSVETQRYRFPGGSYKPASEPLEESTSVRTPVKPAVRCERAFGSLFLQKAG